MAFCVRRSINGLFNRFLSQASTSSFQYFNGVIPPDAVEKKFMRSRGPGGQNVNKVNSKCELRFKLDEAYWLSSEMIETFRLSFPRFVSEDGYVIVQSDKTRYQVENLDECFTKLRKMLEECSQELSISTKGPSEEDVKILKRRMEISARRRLEAKIRQSQKKKFRSRSDW